MFISHKLDKMFNPSAVFAGYLIIVAGLLTIIKGYGFIFIALGSFLSFSQTLIKIDTEKNRFKYYTNLFGIIPIGHWQSLEPFTKITILKSNKIYGAYSLSNRYLKGKVLDYRLVLLDDSGNLRLPLKKCKTLEEALNDIKLLSNQLNLPVTGVHRTNDE